MEIRVRKGLFRRKVGFRFGMFAFMNAVDMNDMSFDELGDPEKMGSRKVLNDIFYSSAVWWSVKEGRKVWFTPEDVERWMDDMKASQKERLMDEFLKSKLFNKPLEEWVVSDKKKE